MCGSASTAWRRLNQWAKARVFDQLHLEVLDRLGLAGRLDWSSASVDSASVRAKRGGTTLAQIPSIVTSQGPSSTWSATAANRACLRRRGITLRIARRGVESSTRLGRHRWRVERTLSWLSCYRRLAVRWDRDSKRWFGFVLLACALVCLQGSIANRTEMNVYLLQVVRERSRGRRPSYLLPGRTRPDS